MNEGQPDDRVAVETDGLTERPKFGKTKARPARRKRLAQCALRFRRVILPATLEGKEPLPLSVVHIREAAPPEEEAVPALDAQGEQGRGSR